MKQKIGIQGIKGSFHHQVAQEYFGRGVDVLECTSFSNLASGLVSGEASEAVMAIENSIAGSILPNYALIDRHGLTVTGEHYIPIHMNLMALQGQHLNEIKEVFSHPMALLQCRDFFEAHPHIRLIEDTDTAEAARRIASKRIKGVGAVAGPVAAELYALEILEKGIHGVSNNTTRFLVLSPKNGILQKKKMEVDNRKIDKASLKFELEHMHGNLASVLNSLNEHQLNLTKIQSLPIIESPWRYSFFIDVTFGSYSDYQKALEVLKKKTKALEVMGEYKNKQQ